MDIEMDPAVAAGTRYAEGLRRLADMIAGGALVGQEYPDLALTVSVPMSSPGVVREVAARYNTGVREDDGFVETRIEFGSGSDARSSFDSFRAAVVLAAYYVPSAVPAVEQAAESQEPVEGIEAAA